MKHIALVIEEDDQIKLYADVDFSQEDIIKHLDNALFMMKDKPMKAICYSKGGKDRGK